MAIKQRNISLVNFSEEGQSSYIKSIPCSIIITSEGLFKNDRLLSKEKTEYKSNLLLIKGEGVYYFGESYNKWIQGIYTARKCLSVNSL